MSPLCQVLDVAFPYGCGDLFATCGKENIRVWVTDTSSEVLRVTVPNMTCHGVCFMTDGHSIISGQLALLSSIIT